MPNEIRIRRGEKENLPALTGGELAYCTDTEQLYIGGSAGNVLLNKESGAAEEGAGMVAVVLPTGAVVIVKDTLVSTDELVPGVSELPTGVVHFTVEAE